MVIIPLQLLVSCNVQDIVVLLFAPLQYEVKNVVVIARSLQYAIKNMLVIVIASCN
jgi:hypothetical protein